MKNKIRELLKKYRDRVDYLELRIEDIESLNLSYTGKSLSSLNQNQSMGGAIRACYKGGWGFCSFVNLDHADTMIETSIKQAKLVQKDRTFFAQYGPIEDDVKAEAIDDPRNYSLEDKLKNLKEYVDIVMNFDPVIKSCRVYFGNSVKNVYFGNSDGTLISQEKLDMSFAVTVNAQKSGIVQSTHVIDGSSNNYGIVKNRHKEVETECKRALKLIDAPPVKGGIYPVIVNQNLGGTFVHEAFGHTSEADVYMDNDQMKDNFRIGKELGLPILNIFDSGIDIGSRGYLKYDDEGVKTEKTYLIQKGMLVGRLHSRESAGKFREKPTGNARALDYRFPPICRMRNTAVDNGTSTFEQLLDGIEEGVYAVDSFGGMGGEQFSFVALYGYMIRKGQIAELVRNVSVNGNLFKTLKNIDAIGNDYQIPEGPGGCGKGSQFPLPVAGSSPHFRIKEMTVGGV
jgi:TldD protein